VRHVIEDKTRRQMALLKRAKTVEGLFSGITAHDLLADTQNTLEFIQQKSLTHFLDLVGDGVDLGLELAETIKRGDIETTTTATNEAQKALNA